MVEATERRVWPVTTDAEHPFRRQPSSLVAADSGEHLTRLDDVLALLASYQLADAQLAALAALSPVADRLPYFTSATAMALATFTAYARTLTAAADAAAARTLLALGTIATQAASAVAITGGTITGLGTPSGSSDAATKGYVDGLLAGLKWKEPVRVATTANGTLASAFENGDTVDGVTLATGDRILLKNQSTGAENGIYTVNASGAPTRATDADTGTELVSACVLVREGTANADVGFVCTNNSITLGSTALTWVQFTSVGGALLAANNLSDLASAGTARTNLGLGSLAVLSTILTAQITDAQVTLAKLANLAQSTIIGRQAGAGTGVPQALTPGEIRAIIATPYVHWKESGDPVRTIGASSTSEETLASATFPFDDSGTTGVWRLEIWGDHLQNSGSSNTATLRIKINDGTTTTTLFRKSNSFGTDADRRAMYCAIDLAAKGAASALLLTGRMFLSKAVQGNDGYGDFGAFAAFDGGMGTNSISIGGDPSDLTVSVTLQWDGSNANSWWRVYSAKLTFIP